MKQKILIVICAILMIAWIGCVTGEQPQTPVASGTSAPQPEVDEITEVVVDIPAPTAAPIPSSTEARY